MKAKARVFWAKEQRVACGYLLQRKFNAETDDDKAIALSAKSRGVHVERWFKAL
ncbi:MAG: hypothetical protein HY862_09935 [Chloroflexi bacterium]|nr:hypothetical protein [Chloroflexota bacterium]